MSIDISTTSSAIAVEHAETQVSPRVSTRSAAASAGASPWVTSVGKRLFDFVCALLLLVPALLITLVVAIVSAVAFRAWPVFTQRRVGRGGKTFVVVKVRSLPTSWPTEVGKHDLEQATLPKISKLIRSTHVDEIPQVFNVLLGHMSFVGPRPMLRDVLDLLPADCERVRNAARPGITGPWQISTMGGLPLHDCPELDVAYVEQATLSTDIFVLWRTVATHFGGDALHPETLHTRLEGA